VTWNGWLQSSSAWDRQWAATNGGGSFTALRSLWHYHAEMLSFHTHLTTTHSYKANPWTWPLMIRPTSFFYGSDATCGAPTCSQEVVPLGNPLIWWGGVIALAFLGYLAVRRRNSSALPVLVAFAAGWVPWLFFPKRTTFTFYSVAFIPYTVMACAIALYYLNKAITSRQEISTDAHPAKQWFLAHWPIVIAVGAVTVLTWYFYPVLVGHSLSYDAWHSKMWFKSWI
jgi:dolichyl-phosphate-mannose--protein O-mannosyl transferase